MAHEYLIDLRAIPKWARKVTVAKVDGEIEGLRCSGCGHVWRNRVTEPKACPECKAEILWGDDPEQTDGIITADDAEALGQPDRAENNDDDGLMDLSDIIAHD